MTRTSWLLFGLALIVFVQAAAGAATEGQPDRSVSLDLNDASLEDALRAVFHDTVLSKNSSRPQDALSDPHDGKLRCKTPDGNMQGELADGCCVVR